MSVDGSLTRFNVPLWPHSPVPLPVMCACLSTTAVPETWATAADNAAIHNGMAVNLGTGIDHGVIPDPGLTGNLRAGNDNGPIPDPGLAGHPGIVADPGLRADISRLGNCRRWPHPSAAVGVDTSRSLDTPRPRLSGHCDRDQPGRQACQMAHDVLRWLLPVTDQISIIDVIDDIPTRANGGFGGHGWKLWGWWGLDRLSFSMAS